MKAIHENSTVSYVEQKVKGRTEHFRKAIFRLASNNAKTDREYMDILKESDVNNVRPEITRLKQDGLLTECAKVICQHTGKKVRTTKASGAAYFTRARKPKIAVQQDLVYE